MPKNESLNRDKLNFLNGYGNFPSISSLRLHYLGMGSQDPTIYAALCVGNEEIFWLCLGVNLLIAVIKELLYAHD